MGHLHKARRWNQQGRRQGAPMGSVIFNDMLMAWRKGDLYWARRHFDRLRVAYPEAIRLFHDVRLS